jgi:hypothetical protein
MGMRTAEKEFAVLEDLSIVEEFYRREYDVGGKTSHKIITIVGTSLGGEPEAEQAIQ